MSVDAHALLDIAIRVADAADAISLPAFRGRLEIREKPDGTPVTQVDVQVERAVRELLSELRPGDAVHGEEDGVTGDPSTPTWVIDPIDGTRSYMTGNPVWATLIACEVDGVPVASVVSAPAMDARWDGAVGLGARRNGSAIQVSTVARLADAQVTFGDLVSFDEVGRPEIVADLTRSTLRQRGYGDFWGFCLVAEGVMDICVEAIASRWDFAAVRGVVEAAGGTFTDLDGSVRTDGGSGVGSNGLLHAATLNVTRR